jgi:hypothetical protein
MEAGICPGAAGFVLHDMVVAGAKGSKMGAQNICGSYHHENPPLQRNARNPKRNAAFPINGMPHDCVPVGRLPATGVQDK